MTWLIYNGRYLFVIVISIRHAHHLFKAVFIREEFDKAIGLQGNGAVAGYFCEIILFYSVVALCRLVHHVETLFHIRLLR